MYLLKLDSSAYTNITFVAGITSLENNLKASCNIFPNPFSETASFNISYKLKSNDNSKLFIFDLFGQEIMQYKIFDNKTEISRGNISSGIYYYKVIINNEIVNIGKIAIK